MGTGGAGSVTAPVAAARPRSARRGYIDVARGIAVLLMIEAHTTDAWTRAASKASVAFRNATILGGFAAPLFLWLAGVAVVLAATRAQTRSGSRAAAVESICRRGLEIFILAFLFRLQAFVVSPGSHPVTLFRVDILNVMGPGIALAGVIWGLCDGTAVRVAAFAAAAAAVALVTPVVRSAPGIDALPTWVQWYLRPAGEYTTFTFFPWIGFVFAGGAVGSLIASARDDRAEARLQIALAAAGAALVVVGFVTAARPAIYASSSFWTSSPTWFAIRLGVMMMSLAAFYVVPVAEPMARMGRSSLFIYWIHVELVYGYASWLWRGRLPLWATLTAYAAFSTLMYGALVLRDHVTAAWRTRRTATPPATV